VGRLPSTAQGDGRTFAFPIKLIGQEKFNLCSPQQGQLNNNTKVNCVKTLNYFTAQKKLKQKVNYGRDDCG